MDIIGCSEEEARRAIAQFGDVDEAIIQIALQRETDAKNKMKPKRKAKFGLKPDNFFPKTEVFQPKVEDLIH